jgi:two-component system OmpR family response regulator
MNRPTENTPRDADPGRARGRRASSGLKVLLAEQERDQLDVTAYMLRRERFVVVEASDAEQALRRFKIERPDVVVVTLELPPPGGLEVLRRIRAEDRTPVLVVTGHSDREDISRCFELGADDFIAKPYVYTELTLRIRALLGRAGGPVREGPEALELDDLRLDPETHEVARGSDVVRLTPTEFRIFYTLVKHAGRVVPATRLFAYVWGSEGGAANSLRSHICHLRKKVGLDGGANGSIASVPAVGYVFQTSARAVGTAPDQTLAEQAAAGS